MKKFVPDKSVLKIVKNSGTFWDLTSYYLIGVLR